MHPQEWHLKCSHYFILTASRGSLMIQALLKQVPGQLVHHHFFIIFHFDGQDHKTKVTIYFTLYTVTTLAEQSQWLSFYSHDRVQDDVWQTISEEGN